MTSKQYIRILKVTVKDMTTRNGDFKKKSVGLLGVGLMGVGLLGVGPMGVGPQRRNQITI